MTTDESIVDRIERLLEEEQRLRDEGPATSGTDRSRVADIEVELDRCWDLLRQRRAAREAGEEPDAAASPRAAETVETYEQ